MNKWQYKDITVGTKESFCVTVTGEMLDMFCHITGDDNPLHTDESFARKKGYEKRVCYGMMTASFLSTFAGVYLPGENSLIHSVETKFVKPVFCGDKLFIEGIVEECNDTFHVITIKVTIKNQDNEKVLRGKMKVGVLDE